LLRSSSFGVFDHRLRPLDQPSPKIVDSRSWDAIPVSDSMCLVRNGRTVMQVSLPELTVLSSRDVPIDAGFGILCLYCDASGSTFAVTNYTDVLVVDMITGDTYEFREQLFNSILIAQPGGPVFTLRDRGDGLLTISQHENDPSLSEAYVEVDLGSTQLGFIRSHFDTAYSTTSHLVVNYTVDKSCAGQNSSELSSVLIARPISTDSEVTFIDGPSWVTNPMGSKVYSLTFVAEQRLSIQQLEAERRQ